MCPLHNLDYEHYLPIFMDGVRCKDNPHKFIARQGVYELLQDCAGDSTRFLDVLDLCILPMRYGLSTKDPDVVLAFVNILKQICTVHPHAGERQLVALRMSHGFEELSYW